MSQGGRPGGGEFQFLAIDTPEFGLEPVADGSLGLASDPFITTMDKFRFRFLEQPKKQGKPFPGWAFQPALFEQLVGIGIENGMQDRAIPNPAINPGPAENLGAG
jgi:hypothetical protein